MEFKDVFKLLEKKANSIKELEELKFITNGELDLDGETVLLKNLNLAKLKLYVLPNMILLQQASDELENRGLAPIKMNGFYINEILEDIYTAISKGSLQTLRKEYESLSKEVLTNRGVPEELKMEYEGKLLLEKFSKNFNK